jgi:hypothetical protein
VAQHDIGRLEERITEVRERLLKIVEGEDILELNKIIHKPGWTTPAEYQLVTAIVETIGRHAEVIDQLQTELIKGSRLVGETERAAV